VRTAEQAFRTLRSRLGDRGSAGEQEDDMGEQKSVAAIGWSMFAAYMMMMIGAFQGLIGFAAILKDDYFVIGQEYLYEFDVTVWGWIHLFIGLLVFVCGLGIFSGNVAARSVGVLIAIGSAISAFAWLPYQPVWSSILIAVNVAVIWALTAHGRDIVMD
jgi:hypothetical protein